MRFFKLYIFFFLLSSSLSFSQKVINHKVKSGESIYAIAKKYDVTQAEIFEMNPKLKGGVLGLNAEVKIPNKKFKEKEKTTKKEIVPEKKTEVVTETISSKSGHLVKPKETLYSISKRYGITMETICELNPELKTGSLKTGMKLKLPEIADVLVPEKVALEQNIRANENKVETVVSNVDVVHKVMPKETLYGISKQTGVSVDELIRLNPAVANGLKVDHFLIISKGSNEHVENKLAVIDTQKEIETAKPLSVENLSKADLLIGKASEHIGTRYRRGGTTSAGFDCSGFMLYTFKNLDLSLPRTSQEMGNYGQKVEKSQAQKGDLIFFATLGRGRISHVGMVTEVLEDEIKFIHSSTSAGVMVSSTKEDYYARSFVKINRVLKD